MLPLLVQSQHLLWKLLGVPPGCINCVIATQRHCGIGSGGNLEVAGWRIFSGAWLREELLPDLAKVKII